MIRPAVSASWASVLPERGETEAPSFLVITLPGSGFQVLELQETHHIGTEKAFAVGSPFW